MRAGRPGPGGRDPPAAAREGRGRVHCAEPGGTAGVCDRHFPAQRLRLERRRAQLEGDRAPGARQV